MNVQADNADRPLAGRTPILGERPPLAELVRSLRSHSDLMQEQLSGIHNPWGAAAFTDPWRFLEICESSDLIDRAQGVLGEDIILWDSELFLRGADYTPVAPRDAEGRYWPAAPLRGAVVVLGISETVEILACVNHTDIVSVLNTLTLSDTHILIVRLMSAKSQFNRDPDFPANRLCMQEQVLINYTNRPLWLISGENRGDSDLVTGFAPPVPIWAGHASSQPHKEEN